MNSELLQLAAALGIFLMVVVAWLFIIYLPGRTMENWEDPDMDSGRNPEAR